MKVSTALTVAALAAVVSAGLACTAREVDEAKSRVGVAVDATKAGADKVADRVIEATKKASDQTQDAAAATGAAVNDGWITAKVKAKFADEIVLEGSDINVDTSGHVVTLRGTVRSGPAKARAGVIAGGTESVTRVVNQLVVQSR